MLSHMLTESESGPRRVSAVHAAPDSLGRDLRPDDSPSTSEGEFALCGLRTGVHGAAAAGAGFAFGQHL